MLCANIVCGICNRVTVVRLTKGTHFCSNRACGATIIIVSGVIVQTHNSACIKNTYECE